MYIVPIPIPPQALLSPLLPTSPTLSTLKRHLACSLVWSMGGHLSPPNKTVFSGWWREAITDPDLALPEGSDIWDYFADTMAPGLPSSTGVTLSGSGSTPFVHTRRAVAMARLVGRLISQGRPVFLVGKPGSGKTSLLLETLKMNDSGSSLQHVYASQVMSTAYNCCTYVCTVCVRMYCMCVYVLYVCVYVLYVYVCTVCVCMYCMCMYICTVCTCVCTYVCMHMNNTSTVLFFHSFPVFHFLSSTFTLTYMYICMYVLYLFT